MMAWIFAAITLAAVFTATFVRQMRHAILALWVAGLGVGGMYLNMGAEFLAIIQWIVCTLVTISLIFFAVMFGEYSTVPTKKTRKNFLLPFLSLVLGGLFAALILFGAKNLPKNLLEVPSQGSDLNVVGQKLTQGNLLSLEVLALTLFLVLVGGGVVARSEGGDDSK
jgi:NADH-quinone oxidoreductase subunit J